MFHQTMILKGEVFREEGEPGPAERGGLTSYKLIIILIGLR